MERNLRRWSQYAARPPKPNPRRTTRSAVLKGVPRQESCMVSALLSEVVRGEFVSGNRACRPGIGVDQRLRQARDLMEQLVVGAFGDGVGCSQRELGVGDDGRLGLELVANPPDADPLHLIDTLHPRQDLSL